MLRDTLVSDGSDDGQDIDEQVDYVQVEVESSEDVLLGWQGVLVLTAHHQLSVVDEVEREEKRAERSVHQRYCLTGDKYGNDTEQQQHYGGTQQHSTHDGEVPAGLEREQRQCQAHRRRHSHCHHHRAAVIHAACNAEQETLSDSKYSEEYEVLWCLASDVSTTRHYYDANQYNDECNPECIGISLHP